MVVFSGCDGTKETPDNPDGTPINVSGIILDNSVSAKKGGDVTLKVVGSHGPEDGDVIVLMNTAESFDNQIKSIDKGSFTFTLDPKVTTGRYEMLVRRNSRTKIVGHINIDIIFDVVDIEPTGGNNVYGVVHCDGEGLADVVVSDGVEVVKTDKDGVYQFKSAKKWGYVFISIPKGYEVGSEGVLPQFHATLTEKADKAERHDFNLVKVNQEKYRVYFLGDMHLADRTNDLNQFDNCMKEVKADIMDDDVKSYVITLGDMTWDLYWYSRKYYFPQYLNSVNYYFKNAAKQVQFFHTIGNHDHDMCKDGDFNTVIEYVKDIAPTYYSFNIGDVHYIVLDDILCTNVGGAASAKPERTYKSEVTDEQLKWLAKDLSYVSKTTPVIVTSHAPVYAKGAAATALYGSRAGNGAVIITTKSGSTAKGIGVTYSSQFTADVAGYWPDFQTEYGSGSDLGLNEYNFFNAEHNVEGLPRNYSRYAFGEKYDASKTVWIMPPVWPKGLLGPIRMTGTQDFSVLVGHGTIPFPSKEATVKVLRCVSLSRTPRTNISCLIPDTRENLFHSLSRARSTSISSSQPM